VRPDNESDLIGRKIAAVIRSRRPDGGTGTGVLSGAATAAPAGCDCPAGDAQLGHTAVNLSGRIGAETASGPIDPALAGRSLSDLSPALCYLSRRACARGTDPDHSLLRFVPSAFRTPGSRRPHVQGQQLGHWALSLPGDGGDAVGALDPRVLSVPGGRHGSVERAHALRRGASASIAVVVLSSRKPPDWCCHSRA